MSKVKTGLFIILLSLLIPAIAAPTITLKVNNTWDKVVRVKEGRIITIDDDIFPGISKTYTLYIAIDNFQAFYTKENGQMAQIPNCNITGRENVKVTFAASDMSTSIPKCIFTKE